MTKDDARALILERCPQFTAQDLDDLEACSPSELAELVASIEDLRKPGPDGWAILLEIMSACVAFANVVAPLAGAVQSVVGIAQAAKGL
jgi:hypothetical protein